jgi:hypothetical protein
MAQRAKEAGLTFPTNPYLTVISLNNDFDGSKQPFCSFWLFLSA